MNERNEPALRARTRLGVDELEYLLPRLVRAEDRPEDIADLAQGRLRSHGIQDRRHQVPLGPGFVLEALKMGVDFPLAPFPSERPQLADAFRFESRVRPLHGDALIALHVRVHADDRPLAALEFDLGPVRRIRDLALDPAGLDRLEHAPAAVRLADEGRRLRLEPIRERLDRVRTADRID